MVVCGISDYVRDSQNLVHFGLNCPVKSEIPGVFKQIKHTEISPEI